VETEIFAGEDGRACAQVDTGVMEEISWREIEPRRVFIAGQNVPCFNRRCRNLMCCLQKQLLLSSASPSQQIDLWFTNIGCAEFGESSSDPLAHWCLSKDVVNFFVPHDQQHNNLELSKPKLLHFSEVTNEITPSASAIWWSEIWGAKDTADKKSASRESGKNTQQKVVFPNTSDIPVVCKLARIQCRVVVAVHCACLIIFTHLLAFCFMFLPAAPLTASLFWAWRPLGLRCAGGQATQSTDHCGARACAGRRAA